MVDNNQAIWEQNRSLVLNHWTSITEEEFSGTQGQAERIVALIAEKYGEDPQEVRRQLAALEKNPDSLKVTPDSQTGNVVTSEEPESQEWNARQSIKEEKRDHNV